MRNDREGAPVPPYIQANFPPLDRSPDFTWGSTGTLNLADGCGPFLESSDVFPPAE